MFWFGVGVKKPSVLDQQTSEDPYQISKIPVHNPGPAYIHKTSLSLGPVTFHRVQTKGFKLLYEHNNSHPVSHMIKPLNFLL